VKVEVMGNEQIAPPGEIVQLDLKANPKILDVKDSKGEIDLGIFELTGNKLKIRSNSKQRPTRVSVPDEKSQDEYLEMEKIE
jgi:uncharacterized protein (TIGR03067 family)